MTYLCRSLSESPRNGHWIRSWARPAIFPHAVFICCGSEPGIRLTTRHHADASGGDHTRFRGFCPSPGQSGASGAPNGRRQCTYGSCGSDRTVRYYSRGSRAGLTHVSWGCAWPILRDDSRVSTVSFRVFPWVEFFEFMLQSRAGWAYYPARISRGGSSESFGSHRVPQGSVLHHGRDECASGRAISARETGAFGRRDECEW